MLYEKMIGTIIRGVVAALVFFASASGCRTSSSGPLDSDQAKRLASLLADVSAKGDIPDPVVEYTLELGKAGADHLISVVGKPTESDEVRIGALRVLAEVYPELAFEPTVAALESGPDNLQSVASSILGKLREKRAITPLIVALQADSQAVAAASALALGQIGDPTAVRDLVRALRREDPVGSAAVSALEQLQSPIGNDELIALLGDPSETVQARAATVLAVTPDDRATPILITLANSPNESLRIGVAKALGSASEDAAVNALSRMTRDSSVRVKRVAIFALGRSPSKQASAVLVSGLRRDQDFKVDYLHALSGRKDDTSVDALIGALSDSDRSVRDVASIGLGIAGSRRAVLPLIAGLDRADRRLGEDAVIALGRIGDSRAIPAIVKMLDSDDQRIALSAVKALSMMTDQAAMDALRVATNHRRSEIREAALAAVSAAK
jgi:HEAT repeat protein